MKTSVLLVVSVLFLSGCGWTRLRTPDFKEPDPAFTNRQATLEKRSTFIQLTVPPVPQQRAAGILPAVPKAVPAPVPALRAVTATWPASHSICYVIFHGPPGDPFANVVACKGTSALITGLTADQPYEFRLYAMTGTDTTTAKSYLVPKTGGSLAKIVLRTASTPAGPMLAISTNYIAATNALGFYVQEITKE